MVLHTQIDRYAPEMELVKHAIDFSQQDVEGAVEVSLYKVRSPSASPSSTRGFFFLSKKTVVRARPTLSEDKEHDRLRGRV